MKFTLLIAIIIAALWGIGYVRIFFKRCALALKLKSRCKKSGAILRPTHALWWLSTNGRASHDLEIELGGEVFAVKLFAVKGRLSTLLLGDNGVYNVKKYMVLFGRFNSASIPILSRERHIPEYTFKANTLNSLTPVLLIDPMPLAIKCRGRQLCSGDTYDGMTVLSAKGLFDRIQEEKNEAVS